jgi:hypothetical protein
MTDPIRGFVANDSQTRLFIVASNRLIEVMRDGSRTERGTLRTRRGYVDMRFGARQLVIVDGPNGYILTLATNVFARITAPGWRGSDRVGYAAGRFLFADPNTGIFYIAAIEDASSIDILDFVTASASPDNIVAPLDSHGEAWLFGEVTVEPWSTSAAATPDFPFGQQTSGIMQTGLLGAFTARFLDNTYYWLGRDTSGGGQVYRAEGYSSKRISNDAIDQLIQRQIELGADMKKAIAYAYQDRGHSFYCLNVPGLDTTLCYDVRTGEWHDRAEFKNGDLSPHRAKWHAYCFGKHIVGGDDGKLYAFNQKRNNNAGDILVRERISPHYAQGNDRPVSYGTFGLVCTAGKGPGEPVVMMRTSDDGGESWNDWRDAPLGETGKTHQRVEFTQNGSAIDRVWHVRVTDDVPFAIISAAVKGKAT